MSFNQQVYQLCRKIPRGKVSTYKAIAEALNTKAYRAVGAALRNNPFAPKVPCHRVVASDGSLYGFQGKREGMALQRKQQLLESEGLIIINKKVKDFEEKLFKF